MKARYLMYFSYLGTHFRGAEKVWRKDSKYMTDARSIQGVIEIALHKLKPLNYPRLYLSSRTDAGVHALNTTAHFDLERIAHKYYYPQDIKSMLNKYFFINLQSIQVRDIVRVPDNFHARKKAKSRTYLYRFAVTKPGVKLQLRSGTAFIPIEEWRRSYYIITPNFDIEKFKEGANLFVGFHDFTSFKKFHKEKEGDSNRRTIYSVEVRPSQPFVTTYTQAHTEELFNHWEIEIKGRGFVHNQIRRMVGVLRSVATGYLEVNDIQLMLQIPSKHSWPVQSATAPPHGLYLCNVEYDPTDLVYNENSECCDRRLNRQECFESDSEE